MKNDLEKWSLVIVGRWNPAILSPEWLSAQVFDRKPLGILFPVIGGFSPIFEAQDIRFTVGPDKVVFAPAKAADDVLNRIEVAASHILTTLPHTPIAAFGENFAYKLDDLPEGLAAMLEHPNDERLRKYGNRRSVWMGRTIEMERCRLNLTITSGQPNRVDLNFHYEVTAAEKAAEQAAELVKGTYAANCARGLHYKQPMQWGVKGGRLFILRRLVDRQDSK